VAAPPLPEEQQPQAPADLITPPDDLLENLG